MAQAKRASKRKRSKIALPAWGAAGMSLAMAGGASAAVAPTADTSPKGTALTPVTVLGEEEIADVSLGTFYVFDKELGGTSHLGEGMRLAAGCRGGGGGGGGCRGGGGGGCRAGGGCAGAGGGCRGGGCGAGRCAGGCGAGRCAGGCGAGRCAGGCRGCSCRCSGGCGCGCLTVGCSCACCIQWGSCVVCF
jgi:hypothetical protein